MTTRANYMVAHSLPATFPMEVVLLAEVEAEAMVVQKSLPCSRWPALHGQLVAGVGVPVDAAAGPPSFSFLPYGQLVSLLWDCT